MEPIRIFYWEGLGLFVLLAVTLVPRLVGELKGLARDRAGWQLVGVTLVVAGRYLWLVVQRGSDGGGLPPVGGWWVALFGTSGAVYGMAKGLQAARPGSGREVKA